MLKLNIKPTQRSNPRSKPIRNFSPAPIESKVKINSFAPKSFHFVRIQQRWVFDQKEFDKYKVDPLNPDKKNEQKFDKSNADQMNANKQNQQKDFDNYKTDSNNKSQQREFDNYKNDFNNKNNQKDFDNYKNNQKEFDNFKSDSKSQDKNSSMKKDYMLHEINPSLRIGSRVLPEDKFEIFVQLNEKATENKELFDTMMNAAKEAAKQYAGGIFSKTMEGVKSAVENAPDALKSTVSSAANVASKVASATGSVASKVAEKVTPKVVSETGEKFKEGAKYAAESILGREIPTSNTNDNATRISIPNKGTLVWTQFDSDPNQMEKKEASSSSKNLNRSEEEKWDELSYSFSKTDETAKFFDSKVGNSEKAQIAMDLLKKEFSGLPFANKLVDKLSSIPMQQMVNNNPGQQSSS